MPRWIDLAISVILDMTDLPSTGRQRTIWKISSCPGPRHCFVLVFCGSVLAMERFPGCPTLLAGFLFECSFVHKVPRPTSPLAHIGDQQWASIHLQIMS